MTLLLCLLGIPLFSQTQYDELEQHRRTADTTVYFIDMMGNQASNYSVARGNKIGILFKDQFGATDSISINFLELGTDHSFVKSFRKSFGMNSFLVQTDAFVQEGEVKTFQLAMKDDMGKSREKYLIVSDRPDGGEMAIDIINSPVNVDCQIPENTFIEFFSEVKGGKAPYQLEWKFGGAADKMEEFLPLQGYSSGIAVSLPPPYQISLKVTDSCGLVEFQTLQVSCETPNKASNSLLFSIVPALKSTER